MRFPRGTMIEIVAAAAVCAGSWFALVRPCKIRLADTRAQIAANDSRVGVQQGMDSARRASAARELANALRRGAAIDAMSEAGDAALIHARVESLANAAGVRVVRVEPRSVTARGSGSAGVGSAIAVSAVAYTIDVVGDFGALVGFLGALQAGHPATVATSVRMTPAGTQREQGHAMASIETTYYYPVRPPVSPGVLASREGLP